MSIVDFDYGVTLSLTVGYHADLGQLFFLKKGTVFLKITSYFRKYMSSNHLAVKDLTTVHQV